MIVLLRVGSKGLLLWKSYSGLSTSKQMWKALEEAFAQGTLVTKLHTCKKDNFSIANYLKCFKRIYDELAVIQKHVFDKIKLVG